MLFTKTIAGLSRVYALFEDCDGSQSALAWIKAYSEIEIWAKEQAKTNNLELDR